MKYFKDQIRNAFQKKFEFPKEAFCKDTFVFI